MVSEYTNLITPFIKNGLSIVDAISSICYRIQKKCLLLLPTEKKLREFLSEQRLFNIDEYYVRYCDSSSSFSDYSPLARVIYNNFTI